MSPTTSEGLRCRGWQQEAALRMLENNLHPDVAEKPSELVVYGGTGKAARDQMSYAAIVRELQRLGDDETLLVQSGKPVAVFETHEAAPRVLIIRDTRESGEMLEAALAAGVSAAGGKAWLGGVLPTPAAPIAIHQSLGMPTSPATAKRRSPSIHCVTPIMAIADSPAATQ